MDDTKLLELAEAIESENELEGAKSRLAKGSPANVVFLLANRSGLLRLAASCLRVAAEPIAPDLRGAPVFIENELRQLKVEKNDVMVGFFQRVENLPNEDTSPEELEGSQKWSHFRTRLALVGCACASALFIVIFLLGLTALSELFF